jgi:hypothetical protein
MPTNAPRTQQTPAASANPATNAGASRTLGQQGQLSRQMDSADSGHKPAGFGLPCSKCRVYYPADLDRCPVCHHNERISPIAPRIPPKSVQNASAPAPSSGTLEKEREEFLKQFKAQSEERHAQAAKAPAYSCVADGHRSSESANAEVCKACYENLQERLDVCEAALHIDLKEAAQIIYDAVWADPSDPNKTYQNAAHALLTELRKRAGMNSLKGAFKPLAD